MYKALPNIFFSFLTEPRFGLNTDFLSLQALCWGDADSIPSSSKYTLIGLVSCYEDPFPATSPVPFSHA